MTQNEKDLLLKDLSARLPYGVKINIPDLFVSTKNNIEVLNEIFCGDDGEFRCNDSGMLIKHVKPYLFPLSSMTEEQKKDLLLTTVGEKGLKLFSVTKDGIMSNDKEEQSFANFSINWINFSNKNVKAYIGWLIKNHFDIHDLIPMGLAVDATGKNIYER